MDVVTYSLRNGQAQSDQYYRDVAAFTDEVLTEAEGRVRPLVEAFQSYLQVTGREVARTRPEYTFELLALGVLWRGYIGNALDTAEVARRALTGLARLRPRSGRLRPGIDLLRRVLAALFLWRENRRLAEAVAQAPGQLGPLLSWLAATGAFREAVQRLVAWRDFLATRPPGEAATGLAAVVAFAAWFETRSEAVLGCYTPSVEQFLARTHSSYRWREDAFFCGRQRVEYHLGMVGTEILNRAFREAFLGAAQKLVLLPPCMRPQPGERCQAGPTPFGARCAGCTPGCRVRELNSLGKEHGFEVLILPDELSVFAEGAARPPDGARIGIVGVSCVLTNVHGGWEARALGVPAQGVLLDYCGCSGHWHKEGIATDVNAGQLLRVLSRQERASQAPNGGQGEAAIQPQ